MSNSDALLTFLSDKVFMRTSSDIERLNKETVLAQKKDKN